MDLRTVVMLKDCKGSPDGVNVRTYYKNEEYNLPATLGKAFVDDLKVAKDVVILIDTELEASKATKVTKATKK